MYWSSGAETTMRLHVFNPDNDMALALGEPGYTPPRAIQQMMRETALLPTCWAAVGDGVLVGERVWVVEQTVQKTSEWNRMLGDALERAVAGKGHWVSLQEVIPQLSEVRPWGWSPAICHRLRVLGIPVSLLPDAQQLAEMRRLSSRARAVEVLASVVGKLPFLRGESVYCTTEQQVQDALQRWSPTILKAPWSSSGKGLRFGQGGREDTLIGWYRRLLQQQGGVVVEPFYDKTLDFAMEFRSTASSVHYCGLSLFETHPNGAYKGNLLLPESDKWKILEAYLHEEDGRRLATLLEQELSTLIAGRYLGPLGVDMMVLADGSIHPCVEINLRMTMGFASLLIDETGI